MRLLVTVWLACVTTLAHADTVAMLPLDGEQRLDIYGQPVAAEIARALRADGVDVVVVGARMGVPDRVQLIVDGTIKMGKGKQITLSIRVRDPRDGTVLDTLPAPATSLDELDKAAAELSARVVPRVKSHLAALAEPATVDKPVVDTKLGPSRPPAPRAPTLEVEVRAADSPKLHPLVAAVQRELPAWLPRQHFATKVTLDVLTFAVEPGRVPLARARVRVQIGGTKFDRVVRTDTIVGDRDFTVEQLAARTAREVLAILVPHLRRTLPVR
jgi:hypothetical protein